MKQIIWILILNKHYKMPLTLRMTRKSLIQIEKRKKRRRLKK
jgi:hypothetical protein